MKRQSRVSKGDENLWLISYSDLITSILAVLVLITSFSKIDIEKLDHANRLMKDDSLVTLSTLKKQYLALIEEKNLQKFVSVLLSDKGLEINMASSVQFGLNSARLNKTGIKKLQPVLQKIVQDSQVREIIISGHTDATGSAARNWELSSQRANAVMLYLMDKGLNYKHSHIVAYASNDPYKSDSKLSKKEQNKRNRRVTILIGRSYKK